MAAKKKPEITMKKTEPLTSTQSIHHGPLPTLLRQSCHPVLALILAASVGPALAAQLTTSVALNDFLTCGISPYQGPRGYGIEAGSISNIISAGLLYRGDYVAGQWGYWTYSEYGTTARYDPVQTGIMGGLGAKLDEADRPFSPSGMAGMEVGPGTNPPRINYLGLPSSLRQQGVATLWVLHSWADPSPWAGTTPPGGPGWGGYTWEPRFWGYGSALILEYATLPAPRVRGAGNGDFQTGNLEGWTSFAPDTGSVEVVTFPTGSTNFAAELTTRRLTALTQLTLEDVDLGFLEFDYLFLANRGRLEVSLGGSLLGVLHASDPVTNAMQHVRLAVPAAVNHAWEPLVFELTGETGEQVLLDNVGWLSALRILQTGSPQSVNNRQVLPLEIQCLTNEFCYLQVAPAVTGAWQAVVPPFPITADRTSVDVPMLEGWPQAFYRLGLWQELRLLSTPQNATAFAGVGDGSLRVTPGGTGPFTYQWQLAGVDLPGQTGATLNLLKPRVTDTGDYNVVVTDAAGVSVTSAPSATLTVEPFGRPVAWWPADQHPLDLAGTNHGTLQGGLSYTNGKASAAFNCVNNGYLSVPDASELNFGANQDFTVAAWVNPQEITIGHYNCMVSKDDGATGSGWAFALVPPAHTIQLVLVTNSQAALWAGSTSAPPVGAWTHVAAVREGSTVTVFVNGLAETTISAPSVALGNTAPLLVGAWYDSRFNPPIQAGEGAKSQVDEVALFNRALSAAEIRALHAAGSAGLHRPLMIIRQPGNATAYLGLSNAPMSVLAAGSGTLNYQWCRDGIELVGQTTASLVLPKPQFSDAGDYTVVVKDGLGVALTSSPPATLTMKLCEAPAPGLVGWWSGDSHSYDLSANQNNGALQGGATYVPGLVAQAFNLDGTNDFVLIPDAPSLNVLGAITVEAWIKPRTLGGNWLSKYNSLLNQRSWDFGMYSDGRVEFFVAGTGAWGIQRAVRTATPCVVTNVFQHVAATFDPATQDMAIYVNGVPVLTQLADYSQTVPAIFASTAPVMIGADVEGDGSMALFNGLIDEAAIYSRALSSPEIAALHAAGRVGKCKDLRIVTPPQDRVAYIGVSNAPLSAVASGVAPFTFQWRREGTNVAGQTRSALLLPSPQLSDSGNYSLVVGDASSLFATSAVVALTVKFCEDTIAAPLAWWPSENSALDIISTNHGMPQGDPGYVSGKVGTTFNFDGTNDFIEVAHTDDLNLIAGQAYTIVAWIKPTVSNYMVIAHKGNDLGSAPNGRQYWQFQARFDLPGAPLQFVMGDTAVRADNFGSISGIELGVWQHVAVVLDNAGGPAAGYHFYLNGVDAGRLVDTDMEVASITSAEPLRIGAGKNRQDEIQGFFTGQIDELMFFNRALSAAEVARMHAAGSAGVCRPGRLGSP